MLLDFEKQTQTTNKNAPDCQIEGLPGCLNARLDFKDFHMIWNYARLLDSLSQIAAFARLPSGYELT